MFLNEASLAGKLHHPHIVQIFDAVVEDEFSYIVMEFVEGGTLEKFCEPGSLLDPAEVAEIIFKCVRALAFAQRLGLTHRDIKPGNILHVDGTDIKIADFGASINKVSDRTVITNVGSPAYMAPELITGAIQASAVTDIYALGVVMYYLLAGRLPFSGANTMSVIYQIVNTEPDPPSTHRQGLLPELDAIVAQGHGRRTRPTATPRGRSSGRRSPRCGRSSTRRASASSPTPSASACAAPCRSSRSSRRTSCGRCCASPSGASFRPTPRSSRKATTATRSSSSPGGYVRVTRGKRTLSVLTAGDCFGEMSYLAHKDSPHRSATVTTTSDCIIVKIRAEDLRASSLSCRRLFDERFLNTLVERLEAANEQLAVMS